MLNKVLKIRDISVYRYVLKITRLDKITQGVNISDEIETEGLKKSTLEILERRKVSSKNKVDGNW